MSLSIVGLFAGLLLTIAAAVGGWEYFLLALILGGVGVVVGKVLDGELDLGQIANARGSSNR